MIRQDMETHATSDSELLTSWVEQRRESAFHALVARYAALVHMAAKRTSGDEALAADASQLVFILLAQKAKSLTTHPTLAGWLHVTSVLKTRDLIDKARRESRKRQLLRAAMETAPSPPPHDAWQEIQPILDDALAALSAKDRDVLLLRFYRSLSVREVAATLGIATDAAQKRIDRATERLRDKLTRRGVQTSGTLSAAILTSFAADAQAALPISILASKAIAAGTVSSFSLTAILTSIAALMKTTSFIPPAVALIVAGVWTGTKYQSLSATEARNARLRNDIAEAHVQLAAISTKPTKDDGSINWERLAAEEGHGPEMQRFQKRLSSMSFEEMIHALDKITTLEVSKDRRIELQSPVVMSLAKIDPAWVLDHFKDRLLDDPQQRNLPLELTFQIWAEKDLAKATAWFDSQISAGNFRGKQLDEDRSSRSRNRFEASLMTILLAVDPSAAGSRMSAIPVKQRSEVMFHLSGPIKDSPPDDVRYRAFANLARSHLPQDIQASALMNLSALTRDDEYPKLIAYLDEIEATPAERIECIEISSGDSIRNLSGKRKVTLDDLVPIRQRFAEISPNVVDKMTARSLVEAVKGAHSSMRFAHASGLALELMETSGSDAVLATFLEITPFNKSDKKLGQELATKISDESRRTEILKRFK